MPPADHEVVLLTRPDCHLCAAARAALARVAARSGAVCREVDVEQDSADGGDLELEYGDRLPVVLLDGREHGYWRVEEKRLLRDLAR